MSSLYEKNYSDKQENGYPVDGMGHMQEAKDENSHNNIKHSDQHVFRYSDGGNMDVSDNFVSSQEPVIHGSPCATTTTKKTATTQDESENIMDIGEVNKIVFLDDPIKFFFQGPTRDPDPWTWNRKNFQRISLCKHLI